MISRLEREKTEDKPWVILDQEKEIFEIGGRSLPENSSEFYTPIKEWLIEYAKSPNNSTRFVCKLDYFNSASARRLLEVFLIMKNIHNSNNEVKITWYCEKDDMLLKKKGEEMLSLVEIPFEILNY